MPSIPFADLPTESYIEGPRFPVRFDRVRLPRIRSGLGPPIVEFFAYESLGAAIGHTEGLACADFDRPRYTLNVVCLMSRDELLKIVQENKIRHGTMRTEALEGYCKDAAAACEKAVESLRAGKANTVNIRMHPPEDHTKDYERAIKMIEMTQQEQIELNEHDFATLVLDEWDWAHSWGPEQPPLLEDLCQAQRREGLVVTDLSHVSNSELEAELRRRKQTPPGPAFAFNEDWPDTAVGWWKITTEGDCEGKTTRDVAIAFGHLGDLALKYANKAMYGLHFEPAVALTEDAAEVANVQLAIGSGTWTKNNDAAVMQAISKWLGPGYSVGPCNYYCSYTIEREEIPPTTQCPRCEGELRYLEDITSERMLVEVQNSYGVGNHRTLIIRSHYTTEGWDESPRNERLWCSSCGFEMPLPEDYDFVFG